MRDHNKAFCVLPRDVRLPGPVFEFGSFQVEGQLDYADLRSLFPGKAYVGCDMRPGPGVDRVEDVSAINLPDGAAGTVCASRRSSTSSRSGGRSTRSSACSSRGAVRHHVPSELSDSRLSRRLLADDPELPARMLGALCGA